MREESAVTALIAALTVRFLLQHFRESLQLFIIRGDHFAEFHRDGKRAERRMTGKTLAHNFSGSMLTLILERPFHCLLHDFRGREAVQGVINHSLSAGCVTQSVVPLHKAPENQRKVILGMLAQFLLVFHGFLHLILLEGEVPRQHQSSRRIRFF